MTNFELFKMSLENNDYEKCAEITHRIIDQVTYQGVAFPLEWKPKIASLLKELHLSGYPMSTEQEFAQMCSNIHLKILECRGNPSLNN